MNSRSLVSFILLSTLVIILLSTVAQASGYGQAIDYRRDMCPQYREVKAEEVLKQIENGEDVFLKNCIVIGELNVSKIKLENTPNPYYSKMVNEGLDGYYLNYNDVHENLGIIESNITIRNSIFENDVNFSGILFKDTFDLANSNFNGSVNFLGANFNRRADFTNSNFNGSANFRNTNFNSWAEFVCTSFNSSADFSGASFNGFVRFNFGHFNDSADLSSVTYNDNVDFTGVVFNDSTDFSDTIVKSYSLFKCTMFNGPTDFSGAIFDGAYFEAQFNDPANFKVPDTSENIYTDGRTCEVFRKSYIDEARYVDADNIYYNFRLYPHENDFQERELPLLVKWEDIINRIVFGYGLKPARTLLVGGFIVGFFGLLYWRGLGIYRSSGTEEEKSTVSGLDALLFSIREFTTLGSADWYPRDNIFRILVTLEGMLGWIMLGIFMATLTNVMIRS